LTSQLADGLFQAYLVAQLVFLNPEKSGTALGVAKAYLVLVIPFSVVGPLAGVFIDRWSRRRILLITPLVRTAAVVALLPLTGTSLVLYVPVLIVVSLNRFYLSTASAVMPTLVPEPDLLVGNSMATVGGTVATFVGIVAGAELADIIGTRGLLVMTGALYPLAALMATGISRPLRAPRDERSIRSHLSQVPADLRMGARRLLATPAAVGSIVSVSFDQFLVGLVTVLSLVVLKEQFGEGVGSFGHITAAGGIGVFVGTITVGRLEDRMAKPRIVATAFAVAGAVALLLAPFIGGITILVISFALGITFSWRKIPVDTIVQEVIPDRFRGRVFAVYDIVYSMARVIAAAVAVVLIPHLSTGWLVAGVGLVYLAWTPVLPWWVRRPLWVRVRFYAGGKADESPRAIVVGGEEQPVEPIASSTEMRGGRLVRRFRVRDAEGNVFDILGESDTGRWHVDWLAP
ncbi:MAG TPA: MFS transporter, partial [Actinomycetota bacterium]|nr:MFS transporter [Actinomycetota bacterium]